MKAKLGGFKKMEAVKYDGFKGLLKKSIINTLSNPDTQGMSNFVVISGDALEWKCGVEDTKHLLYLDENNKQLVKEIKADSAIDLKKYAYGQCKVTRVGSDVVIYLCPEKGKLTQAALLKPLKKTFKTFKPKVFLEVVADLSTIEETGGTAAGISEENEEVKIDPKVLGESLLKYHQAAQAIKQKLKGLAKDDPNHQKMLINHSKAQKHLKRLCNSWKEEILPNQASLQIDSNWSKVYEFWSKFFEKRKAAKAGTNTDTDARQAEEERIYMKALKDVERFFSHLEKSNTIDPDIIDNDIVDLETHLLQWQNFAKDNSTQPEELKAMEAIVHNLQQEWKIEKPKLEKFYQAQQALNDALESGAPASQITSLYNQLAASATI